MKFVQAVSGTSIRLTVERMVHISCRHPEMKDQADPILETVAFPECVRDGDDGTLMAVKHCDHTPIGFVITAYFTNKIAEWRKTKWKP